MGSPERRLIRSPNLAGVVSFRYITLRAAAMTSAGLAPRGHSSAQLPQLWQSQISGSAVILSLRPQEDQIISLRGYG